MINSKTVPIFAPIYSKTNHENLSFLRGTTHYFNFGRSNVCTILDRQKTCRMIENHNAKPSWFGIALRVASLFTIIIPLIMCFATLIYRAANRLYLAKPSQSMLPDDILRIITNNLGPSSLSFGLTSRAHNNFLEREPFTKHHRVGYKALNESIKIQKSLPSSEIEKIIRAKALYYPNQKNIENLNNLNDPDYKWIELGTRKEAPMRDLVAYKEQIEAALKRQALGIKLVDKPHDYYGIYPNGWKRVDRYELTSDLSQLETNLEHARRQEESPVFLLSLAKQCAEFDPLTAKEIVNEAFDSAIGMQHSIKTLWILGEVAQVLNLLDSKEQALEAIKCAESQFCYDIGLVSDKAVCFAFLAKITANFDKERALELAKRSIANWEVLRVQDYYKIDAAVILASALTKIDLNEALKFGDMIDKNDPLMYHAYLSTMSQIVFDIANTNPDKAFLLSEQMLPVLRKCDLSLIKNNIYKGLCLTQPEEMFAVIESSACTPSQKSALFIEMAQFLGNL